MLHELHNALSPVLWRGRMLRGLNGLLIAASLGALIGVGIEIARLMGASYDAMTSWYVILSSAFIGGLVGLVAPISWHQTARLVDKHYQLQDRTVTALSFAQVESPDSLKQLQVADALERLQSIVARDVVPVRVSKSSIGLVGALAVMLGLTAVPRHVETPDPALADLRQVVNEQAIALEETMLEDLRKLIEKQPDPELKELTKELEEMVAELKSPEVDQREALAKISEMQQTLAAALEKLDLQQVDSQLQELAAALEPAESLKSIAESLKAGKYDKAAQELEKMDPKNLDRKERDAVAANLKKFKKDLGEGQQGELSEAAQEMQEGLEEENESQCKSGQCKAAGVCKKQGMKKSLSQCLGCQLNRLSQCKGNCQNPGQCNSSSVAKTDSPSNKAGKGASNQPTGDNKTQLDSTRHREDITGVQGDGPSEREVSSSPEGEQNAARTYSQRYTEYKKQMEEVLDSEPLPLGHRETVRKYFESIRPTQEEATAVDAK